MLYALLAAFLIALLSFCGILFFGKKGHIHGTHRYIVPVAIGVFLGVVFFELIPETLEGSEFYGGVAIVLGFLSFYALSHYLRTYHHHHEDEDQDDDCQNKKGASMLLIGDAIHNIADGIVIASAFLIDPAVGIAATVGIALHEIPQEIAEYGVLIAAGYTKQKALFYNFLSASSIFLGVLLTALFASLGDFIWILTGLAAGNLLYIAASDMIPELNHHNHSDHFIKTFLSTVFGLVMIVSLLTWSHERFGHHEEETYHDQAEAAGV
jgi:zinc and cadmium transporter